MSIPHLSVVSSRSPRSRAHALRSSLLAAALLAGCTTPPATPPSAQELTLQAVGGKEALLSLRGFTVSATGTSYTAGQTWSAGGDAQPATSFQRTLEVDVEGDRLSTRFARSYVWIPNYTNQYGEIVNGERGFKQGTDSIYGLPGGDMLASRTAATRRFHQLLNPQLLLRQVAQGTLRTRDAGEREEGTSRYRLLELADEVSPLTLWVDVSTGELARLTTLETDPLLRDVSLEVSYTGWRTLDAQPAVRFPDKVSVRVGGKMSHEETRSSIQVNPVLDESNLKLPAGSAPVVNGELAHWGRAHHQFIHRFSSIGVTQDGPQTYVQATEVSPGVFFLGGSSHNSMLVEQQSGLVLVEAPLSPERTEALLEWIRQRYPGRPLSHVIITHHHEDHAGGLRTAVARGATLVVPDKAESFFRGVLAAPSKVTPDALSTATSLTPTVRTVAAGGVVRLEDAQRPVEVRPITTTHAEAMSIIYLPAQGIVFNSDLYSPGFSPYPTEEMRQLATAIAALPGSVTTLVGGHGGVGPRSELDTALSR